MGNVSLGATLSKRDVLSLRERKDGTACHGVDPFYIGEELCYKIIYSF
jgi:hypothetical protein